MMRVNLMSREAEHDVGRRQERRLVVLGAILLVCVLLGFDVRSRMQLSPVREELQRLQADLARLDAVSGELTALESQRQNLDAKLKAIALLQQKKLGPVQILTDLSSATPNDLWLLEFTELEGAATITGLAPDNQTIAVFMRNLSRSPYFASVDLVETTQSERNEAPVKRFVLNARLSYTGAPLVPPGLNLKFPEPSKEAPPPLRKGKRA
jgi:type IV pilus assembly protein PilN